jgi:hypothetical protein
MTLCTMTLNISIKKRDTQHNGTRHLILYILTVLMLSVVYAECHKKSIMLNVIILSVIMLNVVLLIVVAR